MMIRTTKLNQLFRDSLILIFLATYKMDSMRKARMKKLIKKRQLKAALADWAVTCRVKRTHVTMLLHVLHDFLPFLPKDSRTLLKTMRSVSTKDVPPEKYYHF